MAFLTTERLLEDAKNGTKLSTEDRRKVVLYLQTTQPELSNRDLGEIFQVSEITIRRDKQALREEMAEELRQDDVGLVIADIAFTFKRQIRDLERSKAQCRLGTTEYRKHCEALFNLEREHKKILQDLGWLPKNLGSMTMTTYEYAAIVLKDGSVETRPLAMFDDETQKKIRTQLKGLPQPQQVEPEYIEEPAQREVVYAPANATGELSQDEQGAQASSNS